MKSRAAMLGLIAAVSLVAIAPSPVMESEDSRCREPKRQNPKGGKTYHVSGGGARERERNLRRLKASSHPLKEE